MYRKSIIALTACLLITTAGFAQQKKPVSKPKPKPKPTAVKKPVTPPAATTVKETVCYPLKEVKDYYKIDLRDKQFKSDFEEIFELSPYDYSGYAMKSILENTIRTRLGDAQANTLDLFAGSSYVEISFTNSTYRKQIIDEICNLFADHNAFEKYINSLKKK